MIWIGNHIVHLFTGGHMPKDENGYFQALKRIFGYLIINISGVAASFAYAIALFLVFTSLLETNLEVVGFVILVAIPMGYLLVSIFLVENKAVFLNQRKWIYTDANHEEYVRSLISEFFFWFSWTPIILPVLLMIIAILFGIYFVILPFIVILVPWIYLIILGLLGYQLYSDGLDGFREYYRIWRKNVFIERVEIVTILSLIVIILQYLYLDQFIGVITFAFEPMGGIDHYYWGLFQTLGMSNLAIEVIFIWIPYYLYLMNLGSKYWSRYQEELFA